MSITTVQRQDGGLYLEGVTQGQAIWLELAKHNWIMSNVTATIHTLDGNGKVQIPVFKKGALKGFTELCEDGNVNKANFEFRSVDLSHKVSGEFNGCFTVAGIADPKITESLDSATIRQMSLAYSTGIETELINNAQPVTITDTKATYFDILMSLKKRFFEENRTQPTAVLVSARAFIEIAKEHGFIPTSAGSLILTSGNVGTYAGLTIIETNITDTDIIMISPESVHIAVAGNPQQASPKGVAGESFELFNQMNGFSAGMISKIDSKPLGVGEVTYLHVPIGVTVIPELAYKITLPTPETPDVISFGTSKIKK